MARSFVGVKLSIVVLLLSTLLVAAHDGESPHTSGKLFKAFGTNVYSALLTDRKELNENLKNFLKLAKNMDPQGQRKSNIGGYQTQTDLFTHMRPKIRKALKEFPDHKNKKGIMKAIESVGELQDMISGGVHRMLKKAYTTDLIKFGDVEVKFGPAWMNSNVKDNWNLPHNHAGSFFAGVYYVSDGGSVKHNKRAEATKGYNKGDDTRHIPTWGDRDGRFFNG